MFNSTACSDSLTKGRTLSDWLFCCCMVSGSSPSCIIKLAMDLFVSNSSTFSGVDGNICPVLKCKSSADV